MSNTKKSLASDKELERFEQFLFEMDDVLEAFVETVCAAAPNSAFIFHSRWYANALTSFWHNAVALALS